MNVNYFDPQLHVRIENDFSFHPVKPEMQQEERYSAIRDMLKEVAHNINKLCPNSREKSTAFTHLEQVSFYANAAIARHE